MGADQTVQILQEPLVDLFPKVKKPTFKLVEEHESFTEKVCHVIYQSCHTRLGLLICIHNTLGCRQGTQS